MSITKQIRLKPETKDAEYTEFCNMCERQGIFVSCGNTDDKWILVRFEDVTDYLAWMVATGMAKVMPALDN